MRLSALLALLLLATPAFAQDAERARQHYEQGTAEFDHKDYGAACHSFLEADALAPNDAALEAALHSCILANDAPSAMTAADRVDDRATTRASVLEARDEAKAKLSSQVGRLLVTCEHCTAKLDDAPLAIGRPVWAPTGSHTVEIVDDARAEKRSVDLAPGQTIELRPSPPPQTAPALPPPHPKEERASGISPWWFWGGVTLSAGLTATTIGSFVDAVSRNEAFVTAKCPVAAGPGCADSANAGRDAEIRSYVLLGAAAAVVLATAAVGIWAVRWKDGGVAIGPSHIGLFARY